MTLIRTGLLNGIAVVIKMLTLLGINKVLAVYVGPAGYATIGQFQNAVQMITTFASGAINTGVTKYTAEYYESETKQRMVWRTAGTIVTVASLFTATVIAILNRELANWFLKNADYGSVFLWLAATLVLFTINALLLAILNGKKEIGRYVLANITGSLFALAVTSIMAVKFGLYGALIALAIYQSTAFFATFLLCCGTSWFQWRYLFGRTDKRMAINLGKYAGMALTSAVCVPISHILVRNHLGETLGWTAAGYWEAMWRLSAAYLMLVTTTLSVYYLPRLSELRDAEEIKKEINQGYKLIFPLAALSAAIIYLGRDFVIKALFTDTFAPMQELFGWQLMGDALKIGSWLLSYVMLGKAMYRSFIVTEVAFSISFVGLAFVLTRLIGIKGVSVAHFVNYACYWLVISILMKRHLKRALD